MKKVVPSKKKPAPGRERAAHRKSTPRTKQHVFQVLVEQDEEGYFVAECPALKACYTQGETYEEAIANIRDVIALCLDDLKEKGKEVPRQSEIIGIKRLEIGV